MTRPGEQLRRSGRASGYAALVAVVLFVVVGVTLLARGDVVPQPPRDAWVGAGDGVAVALGSRGPVWGVGDDLDPAAVRCTWTSRQGASGTLDTAMSGTRPSAATDRGTAVLLADAHGTEAHEIRCSGGGLTSFAVAAPTTAPPTAALGTGFFVFAAVAAVWAVVALRVTRRRAP